MNATLAKLLADRKPSKRGIHGTANVYTTPDYYEQQFGAWLACGFSWLKIVVSGDSQVETVRRLAKTSIIPVVRFYDTSCPHNIVAPDLCKPYTDEGVVVFESPFNEFYAPYENSWRVALRMSSAPTIGGAVPGEIVRSDLSRMTLDKMERVRTISLASMPADWPQQVGHGWAMFAESVLKAGGVPTTPAIEGWRYEDIFEPLFAVICTTYKDTLKQSIIAMHNRPLNHPIDYTKDSGGYLAWRMMDAYVFNRVGEHVPMIATEAGPEPGWDMDRTYPKITAAMHAEMTKDMLRYPTPDYYLADCSWLWRDDGTFTDASFSRNRVYADGKDLPVVSMLQTWRPDAPTPDLSDAAILQIGLAHPSVISVNPDAMFYKVAQAAGFGHPECSEWDEKGWRLQKYERGIVAAKIGEWDKVRTVKR